MACSRRAVWLLAVTAMAAAAFLPAPASAVGHIVGGREINGWTLSNYSIGWAEGKTFRVGDTLVFNYPAGNYTVTEVDAQTFKDCYREGNRLAEWATGPGHDAVELHKPGRRWFFSSLANHCDLGLRFVVDVDGPQPPAPAPAPHVPAHSPAPTPAAHPPVPSPAPTPNNTPPTTENSSAALNHHKISEAAARAAVLAGAVLAAVLM